jgi:hypothetical protein
VVKLTNFVESRDNYDATDELIDETATARCFFIRSDRQTKTALAVTTDTPRLFAFDGSTWQEVPPPDGNPRLVDRALEVIVRGGTP